MIFSLIVLLVLIVFLAFFVGKNLTNVCTFWIFKTFTDLPVAILALISFACGIVISILIYVLAKIKKSASADVEKVEDAESKAKKEKAAKNRKLAKEIRALERKNKKIKKSADNKSEENSLNSKNQDVPKNE